MPPLPPGETVTAPVIDENVSSWVGADRPREASYHPPLLGAALAVVKAVDAGDIARADPEAADLPGRIHAARLAALRAWREAARPLA